MSITERIYLKNWNYDGPDRVKLVFSDDERYIRAIKTATNAIWQKQLLPVVSVMRNLLFLLANGRRQQLLVSHFVMPALDYSSLWRAKISRVLPLMNLVWEQVWM